LAVFPVLTLFAAGVAVGLAARDIRTAGSADNGYLIVSGKHLTKSEESLSGQNIRVDAILDNLMLSDRTAFETADRHYWFLAEWVQPDHTRSYIKELGLSGRGQKFRLYGNWRQVEFPLADQVNYFLRVDDWKPVDEATHSATDL
jgi:hypothetical protein